MVLPMEFADCSLLPVKSAPIRSRTSPQTKVRIYSRETPVKANESLKRELLVPEGLRQ